MAKKIGRAIAFGDNSVSIFQEGGARKVYKFSPREVKGNLYEQDEQCLDYPARLNGKFVTFTTDATDMVVSVSTFVFNDFMCKECSGGIYTMAAKACECGNIANSVFKQCEACAVEKDECAACGAKLS